MIPEEYCPDCNEFDTCKVKIVEACDKYQNNLHFSRYNEENPIQDNIRGIFKKLNPQGVMN